MSDAATCSYGHDHRFLFRTKPCRNPSKVVRDGKHFCGVHDPVAKKEKQDARSAARREEWAREAKAREAQRRIEKYEYELDRLALRLATEMVGMKDREVDRLPDSVKALRGDFVRLYDRAPEGYHR